MGVEREVTRVPRSVRRFYLPVITVCVLVVGLALANAGDSSQPSKPDASATKRPTLYSLVAAATAAPGITLRYDGVTASGVNATLDSFQWGVARSITPGGASAPSVAEITVTKPFDDYSGPLLNASLRGAPTKAIVYFYDTAGAQFLQFTLEGVQISGYSTSSGGDKPSESISLHFTKVTMKAARAGKPDYSVTYDLVAPTP
jgi:type VI secretion system secreted protein Hcp